MIVIAGPTGSGKSSLSLRVAREFNGEVVNCDSVQIYRYFDIGSAKLSEAERMGIPHHLIDIASPDQVFSAGDYCKTGRAALAEIASRGKLPVVTGGTGFYLRALLDGLMEGPTRDEPLRERLTARNVRRPGSLHRLLTRFDPPSAARIHANDINKLIRALEICLTEQEPLSSVYARGRDPLVGFEVIKIGLDPQRDELYQRLDARSATLFENGIIDEARSIIALGYAPEAKPFESLGYKQALAVLQGRMSQEEAIEETKMHTRRYAKRQLTWFRREKDMRWFAGFGDDAALQEQVCESIAASLR